MKDISKYKAEIDALAVRGHALRLAMLLEISPGLRDQLKEEEEKLKEIPKFNEAYQIWYSEALASVRQLLPDRLEDFISYYRPQKPRKDITNGNYTISDFLQSLEVTRGGRTVTSKQAALPIMEQQVQIIESIKKRFDSSLFDIRALVQADLFDHELDAADELNRKGFRRAAGAMAGVVLEGHLLEICSQHKLGGPRRPSISELNDLLKKAEVIDVPTWRGMQRLGDIRNLCDHKKSEEPTKETIGELVDGVRKTIKTVF